MHNKTPRRKIDIVSTRYWIYEKEKSKIVRPSVIFYLTIVPIEHDTRLARLARRNTRYIDALYV